MTNFAERANFLWAVAELLRDSLKRSKYQDVILPFTVLRRIDCVLQPTKEKVLQTAAKLRGKGLKNLDPQLRRAAGFAFYNTSRYDFEKLLDDPQHDFIPDDKIKKIAKVFHDWKNAERFAKIITIEEAIKNDYNLSPSRYVETGMTEEYREIPSLLGELTILEQESRKIEGELKLIFNKLGFKKE